jgi:cytochrome c
MKQKSRIGLLVVAGAALVFSAAGIAATLGTVQEAALPQSQAEDGRVLFAQVCGSCHTSERDRHKGGPSLFGVVGRRAGSVSGFEYSEAMKQASLTWYDESLDHYLANPKRFVPGNRMPYSLLMGAENDQRRQNVIAYLHTLR